jgi:hypothetical protein
MTTHRLLQRRACGLIGIARREFRRAPREDRNRLLRQRLRKLVEERRRSGYPLLYLMLRRVGFEANHQARRADSQTGRGSVRPSAIRTVSKEWPYGPPTGGFINGLV